MVPSRLICDQWVIGSKLLIAAAQCDQKNRKMSIKVAQK